MTAFNFVTNTEYRGANAMLKGNGKYDAFATFNQIRDAGYKVNKGAKATRIFCSAVSVIEKDKTKSDGLPKRFAKFALVFDIADTNALQDKDLVAFLETGKRTTAQETKQTTGKKASAESAVKRAGLNMPSALESMANAFNEGVATFAA